MDVERALGRGIEKKAQMKGALASLAVIGIPLGQEQRKDYKLYLHWGRVHPESASGPKITEQKRQECLSEPIAKCSD